MTPERLNQLYQGLCDRVGTLRIDQDHNDIQTLTLIRYLVDQYHKLDESQKQEIDFTVEGRTIYFKQIHSLPIGEVKVKVTISYDYDRGHIINTFQYGITN